MSDRCPNNISSHNSANYSPFDVWKMTFWLPAPVSLYFGIGAHGASSFSYQYPIQPSCQTLLTNPTSHAAPNINQTTLWVPQLVYSQGGIVLFLPLRAWSIDILNYRCSASQSSSIFSIPLAPILSCWISQAKPILHGSYHMF